MHAIISRSELLAGTVQELSGRELSGRYCNVQQELSAGYCTVQQEVSGRYLKQKVQN